MCMFLTNINEGIEIIVIANTDIKRFDSNVIVIIESN
jgi:hypothetical protein